MSHRLFGLPAALLVVLIWCTTLTVASVRPTRTVKRTMELEPIFITDDQCASFHVNLGKELKSVLHLNWMEYANDIDMCLCNSTLSDFVSHSNNRQIEIARALAGKSKVQDALQTLITKSNNHKTCSPLPAHATRTCAAGNSPCSFTCQSPYRKASNGKSCVLPASPSARPRLRTYEEEAVHASSNCRAGEQVCAGNGNQFKCTDVTRNLVNCGGCSPESSVGLPGEVLGVDCSELPGVSDVQCASSKCSVTQCKTGWRVNSTGDGCIRTKF